jgi:hypothetical protein
LLVGIVGRERFVIYVVLEKKKKLIISRYDAVVTKVLPAASARIVLV